VIVGTMLGGIALLIVFVVWSNQSDRPMLNLWLFRNRVFSSALGSVTAVFFANFAVVYLLSQYLQFVLGYDAFQVGIRLLPSAIGMLISANLASRVAHRYGLRRTMVSGMALAAGAQAVLATISSTTGYPEIGLAYGLMGFGTGLTVAPASNAIVGTLPPDKVGAGSGLRATVQLLGASFGVAVIGSIVISRYRHLVEAAFSGPLKAVPPSLRPSISSQVGVAHSAAAQLPSSLAHTTTQIANHAFAAGIRLGSIISLCVILAAMLAAARYVPRYTSHQDDEEMLLAAATPA
jgi:predicted MFS family arabinose efflux permease